MSNPLHAALGSILADPKFLKKLALYSALPVGAVVAILSTAPTTQHSIRMAFRTLYWSLIRSRGARNIVLTAIVLSVVSRHMVKGLPRKLSFPVSFLIVWYLYYKALVVSPSRLRCQRTCFNIQVIEKAQLATTKFQPTPWGFNRHSQTILMFFVSHLELWWQNPLRYAKELVPCSGPTSPQPVYWVELDSVTHEFRQPRVNSESGEEVYVDSRSSDRNSMEYSSGEDSDTEVTGVTSWREIDSDYMNEPILLFIHGLGNDRHHIALQRYARAAREAGWKVVIWEYVAESVTDTVGLRAVIDHISKKYPASPLCAIAWSLGGLYLLKYLTEVGKDTPLVCAISVSGCLSLLDAANVTRSNENRAYWHILASATKVQLRRFLSSVQHLSEQVRAKLTKHLDIETDPLRLYDYFQFYAGKNPQRYDTPYAYLSPATLGDYQSMVKDFHRIGVTTLLIHADDDPMVSNNIFNATELARSSKYIISLSTRRGGHIAFYEGLLPFGKTWDLRISMQFISAVIESLAQVNHILTVMKRVDSAYFPRYQAGRIDNLTDSNPPSQLPGALARIVSSASIYSKTPNGNRSPFPETEELPNFNAVIPKLNDLFKARNNPSR